MPSHSDIADVAGLQFCIHAHEFLHKKAEIDESDRLGRGGNYGGFESNRGAD